MLMLLLLFCAFAAARSSRVRACGEFRRAAGSGMRLAQACGSAEGIVNHKDQPGPARNSPAVTQNFGDQRKSRMESRKASVIRVDLRDLR